MIRSAERPAAAAQPEAQTVPADLAAAAEQHRGEAEQARERAVQARAEAETLLGCARAEAARIVAEAEAAARILTTAATAGEHEAGTLEEQGRLLDAAAGGTAQAEEAEARAAELEGERDRLREQAAGLGEQLGKLAADRGDLEARLTAALAAGDIDTITTVRGRITASDELAESLSGQRPAAQARIDAIGTGEFLPLWPQKELAEVRRIASGHRGAIRRVLNAAYPDRPEAVEDARRERYRAVAEVHAARAAEEARRKPEPRRFVHL